MSRIYHMMPRNFTGDVLYSLNKLKTHLPEIYAAQAQKYSGREVLMQTKIPLLGCLWNDVLHFSSVHPSKIRDAFINAGFGWRARLWFAIEPSSSGFVQENAVIFLNTPSKNPTQLSDFNFPITEFMPFSPKQLGKLTELPEATSEYLKFAKEAGEQPFLFNYVPHILYRGEMNVSSVEIVDY